MQKVNYLPFYFFVLSLFLGVTAKSLFTDGMFMDGLWYATISRNLAVGLGSFWDLFFSETVYPHFHEHPPLAMGLQSIFFRLFGNSILIERFYSFFTFIITGWIMVLIWKRIVNEKFRSLAWLPLLFFVVTPLSTWCVSNNLLENTMMVFTSLSILFMILSLESKRYLHLLLAGLMIFLGVLTKGPVALFPLSFVFWVYLIKRNITFRRFVIDTLVVTIGVLTPFLIIYVFEPEGIDSLKAYFNRQLVGSFRNPQTVENRFYIVWNLITNLIPVGVLMLLAYLLTLRNNIGGSRSKWALIMIALGLSGVIPIMVSQKQSSFYMLAAIPFLCIALADLIAPRVYYYTNKIDFNSRGYKWFKWVSYLFLSVVVIVTVMQHNRIDRDVTQVEDVYKIRNIVPENSILSIQPEISKDWGLHGYFYRYAYISIDFEQKHVTQYIIVNKGYSNEFLDGYKKYPVELNMYDLYEKDVP